MFFKPVLLTKSFDMTTLDIITIVLFSLGVVLVGLAFSQKVKVCNLSLPQTEPCRGT